MSSASTPRFARRHAALVFSQLPAHRGENWSCSTVCLSWEHLGPSFVNLVVHSLTPLPSMPYPHRIPPGQANALLRKNGVQQRRAWVQNLVAVCMPIFFCLLLWGLQKVINNGALGGVGGSLVGRGSPGLLA